MPALVLMLVVLVSTMGCISNFRTGLPLPSSQRSLIVEDLAVAGVLARRPGGSGTKLPESAARLAELVGVPDRSSAMSERELATLLESPTAIRGSMPELDALASRIGHRYLLVGEATTVPTDEAKSWIIQVVLPIPYLWVSFGIPVRYASNADVPHAAVSARVVDLNRGEILAASFEVASDLDEDETPPFKRAAASRAVERMALGGR